jgi:hypothetical protein
MGGFCPDCAPTPVRSHREPNFDSELDFVTIKFVETPEGERTDDVVLTLATAKNSFDFGDAPMQVTQAPHASSQVAQQATYGTSR